MIFKNKLGIYCIEYGNSNIIPGNSGTESADGSGDEIEEEYDDGRASKKKKEKKRQEREAQRQVTYMKFCHIFGYRTIILEPV